MAKDRKNTGTQLSLGYRPPAPEALLPADPVPVPVGLT